jgi:phosphoribosyl 1,2-cyclic phosphate phosphodiesterase
VGLRGASWIKRVAAGGGSGYDVGVSAAIAMVPLFPPRLKPMPYVRPDPACHRSLRGQLLFLGTGTSVGVPMVGCGCDVCTSADPRNQRTRTSVVVGLPGGNLLIDTTPDLRSQLLRERISRVDAILYSHGHVDHVYGLDDIRPICFASGGAIPVFCEELVERRIRVAFDYAFETVAVAGGGLPQMVFSRIGLSSFELLGAQVTPIRLRHGVFDVLGFRFGNVAYCTDTNAIPEESWPLLAGLDLLILDGLRGDRHPTHFSIDEAVAVARRTGAARTLLVHMSHDVDHAAVSTRLPDGIGLAYDGLAVPLS